MKVNKKSQEHIKEQREDQTKKCVNAEEANQELLQNFNIGFISSYVLLTL